MKSGLLGAINEASGRFFDSLSSWLTEKGSGLLITAIAGGALVVVQGMLADTIGLQESFWLTVGCELFVLFYVVWGSKPVIWRR